MVVCGEVSLYDLIAYALSKYVFAGLQRIWLLPTSRLFSRFLGGWSLSRHDAHLSASEPLVRNAKLLGGLRGARNPKQGVCVYSITIYQVNCYLSLASMPGMVV
ncbi:hypothetical protein EVAR_73907_1 [Eumeta japonica]|uniref:Uncharacterized protein n=1 Tax=Eumeta variegata TaxID=151549 RepID=A0A4C1SRA3_EUMVA|nr:hypothetical protein EVAR_73907_1 [Eumeta japonica]